MKIDSRFLSRGLSWWEKEPRQDRSKEAAIAELDRLMRQFHPESFPSHKRLKAVRLSLEGGRTVAAIAALVGVSQASVFNYRKAYKERGVEGLVGRGRGRPPKTVPLPLQECVTQGLRRMSCFHLPTLSDWVRHNGGSCPDWRLRRLAKQSIALNRFQFPETWRQFSARAENRSSPCNDGQTVLDLHVMDSHGLKPWFDLPKDDWDEWFPYMRQGRPLSSPIWKW